MACLPKKSLRAGLKPARKYFVCVFLANFIAPLTPPKRDEITELRPSLIPLPLGGDRGGLVAPLPKKSLRAGLKPARSRCAISRLW